MYVQSFSADELSAMIRKADWRKYHSTYSQATRNVIVQEAVEAAASSFSGGCSLTQVIASGRPAYKLTSLRDELVLRKLAANVRIVTRPSLSTRDALVSSMRDLLCDGSQSRLYRLDLKSFYESFNVSDVMAKIEAIDLLSARSRAIFAALMKHYALGGGIGIPAGLEISSLVAEYMMRSFDHSVRNMPTVYFYGRFVDDIAVITQGNEESTKFVESLKQALPAGTSFAGKGKKFSILSFSAAGTSAPLRQEFEYLGYKFIIKDPTQHKKSCMTHDARSVRLDYSAMGLNRIKTRMVKAFLAFKSDKDFELLEARIRFLTMNVRIRDSRTNITKLIGVKFNHPHLTPFPSCGLQQLDSFLHGLVSAAVRPSKSMTPALSSSQKRVLFRSKFSAGFAQERFTSFSRKRLSELSKCWAYVS